MLWVVATTATLALASFRFPAHSASAGLHANCSIRLLPAWRSAFRALDGTEHLGIGKLVVSFSNPVKASDPHRGPGTGTGVNRPMGMQGGRGMQSGAMQGGRGGPGGMQGGRGMMVRRRRRSA
jgi:hypothetical protein